MRQELRKWIKDLEFSLTRDELNRKRIIEEVIHQMQEEIAPIQIVTPQRNK